MRPLTHTRGVLEHLASHIFGKTLDFGAGTAKYREIITPHATEYLTFDMAPGEHIDVVGDALRPPFEDASFDTIIATQVLEHVEKPWVVVHEMGRMLKTGGICIVTAPFLVPYHADPHDFFRYTVEGMESLFKNEGFTIVESGKYGNAPALIAEMIHFGYFSRYKKRSKVGARLRDAIMNAIKRIAFALDRFFGNKALYANVYVVAKKGSRSD